MKIWKFELTKERTQVVKMPEKSEIMDTKGLLVVFCQTTVTINL